MATAEKISAKLSRGEETRHTVRKVLADFAACAADDVKFSKIEENGQTFRAIELSNSVIS